MSLFTGEFARMEDISAQSEQELERVTKTVFYALALYDIIYSIITRQNQIDNPLYFK